MVWQLTHRWEPEFESTTRQTDSGHRMGDFGESDANDEKIQEAHAAEAYEGILRNIWTEPLPPATKPNLDAGTPRGRAKAKAKAFEGIGGGR